MSSKLMIGFAAGVVVGMLFAPEKGDEMRRKLSKTGSDLKTKFNDFIDSLQNKVDDLSDEAEDFASKAKSSFS
jgi:gas vesicle protein